MNARVSSKRSSRRRSSEANSSNGKVVLNVDTYMETGASRGGIRGQDSQAVAASAVPPTNQPVGQQAMGSTLLIDVEAIEDDVQLLSSSRGFPQGRNQSRRNRPITVVIDEDPDVQAGPSGVSVEEPVSADTCNRQKLPPKRTIINSEVYENVDFGHKTKCPLFGETDGWSVRMGLVLEVSVNFSEKLLPASTLEKKCVAHTTEALNTAPKEHAFTCAICWGQLTEETSTICGHIFCQGCIKAAIQAQKKCPTCRRSLTMKNIHRVYLPTAN